MTKHMISNKARCPFYRHEDAQVIYCDGVQDGSVIHLAFASKTDARNYKHTFCYDKHEYCYVAKMLYELEGLCTK